MSGTRSASRTEPAIRRNLLRLGLILSPFVFGAVAINLFMLGLISASVGWPNLSPIATLIVAVPLTLPATWAATRWVGGLMDEAER